MRLSKHIIYNHIRILRIYFKVMKIIHDTNDRVINGCIRMSIIRILIVILHILIIQLNIMSLSNQIRQLNSLSIDSTLYIWKNYIQSIIQNRIQQSGIIKITNFATLYILMKNIFTLREIIIDSIIEVNERHDIESIILHLPNQKSNQISTCIHVLSVHIILKISHHSQLFSIKLTRSFQSGDCIHRIIHLGTSINNSTFSILSNYSEILHILIIGLQKWNDTTLDISSSNRNDCRILIHHEILYIIIGNRSFHNLFPKFIEILSRNIFRTNLGFFNSTLKNLSNYFIKFHRNRR